MGEFDTLQGTHEDVFHIGGPLGPRIERAGNLLKSTDKDGNLTRHKVLAPTEPDDAATRQYVLDSLVAAQDTFCMMCSRYHPSVSNVYLSGGETPTNLTPLVMPYNVDLVAIAARANVARTWIARVYKNAGIISPPVPANAIASLTLSSVLKATTVFATPIPLNSLDDLAVYVYVAPGDSSVEYPRVELFFRRR